MVKYRTPLRGELEGAFDASASPLPIAHPLYRGVGIEERGMLQVMTTTMRPLRSIVVLTTRCSNAMLKIFS